MSAAQSIVSMGPGDWWVVEYLGRVLRPTLTVVRGSVELYNQHSRSAKQLRPGPITGIACPCLMVAGIDGAEVVLGA